MNSVVVENAAVAIADLLRAMRLAGHIEAVERLETMERGLANAPLPVRDRPDCVSGGRPC